MENNSKTRTFAEIAREIQRLWPNMYFGADTCRIKTELKSMLK